jgi:hypothetical protein
MLAGMRRLALVPILSILGLGLFAPAGIGATPLPVFPKKPKLVIPTELAGVRLGMKVAAIRRLWGDPGTCPRDTYATCAWGGLSTGSLQVETAAQNTIQVVDLQSREGQDARLNYYPIPSVAAPLSKIKSRQGIGIGSKLTRVMKKFPRGRKMINRAEDWVAYDVSKRNSTMVFEASLSKGLKIIAIRLQQSHVD